MLEKVLDTYKCLLSCCKKMPGMRLEDAFSAEAIREIELEYEWIKQQCAMIKVDKE
jgi:hypothetical protein